MNTKETKKSVFVAMSGGVDSSVSAALLKEKGYAVTGVFIRVWHPQWLPCDWKKERQDAMRVCATLDIPFATLDLSKEYKQEVADYMIDAYQKGRTPNPDVMCNKYIKFGAFLKWAKSQGATHIATGHYAQIKETGEYYHLLSGVDDEKDQSYFLWTLTQDILSQTLFPVGHLKKKEVRKLAKKYKLPVSEKKDSQGVCFLGNIDMHEFLKHYIDVKPGDVLDTAGNVIGQHHGSQLYTIGQRHGFRIDIQKTNRKPHYVSKKDVSKNTITVTEKMDDRVQSVQLGSVNWISNKPSEKHTYQVRIRYRQPLRSCNIKDGTTVVFEEAQPSVAVGQSLVVYDGEVCVGGGIIESTS